MWVGIAKIESRGLLCLSKNLNKPRGAATIPSHTLNIIFKMSAAADTSTFFVKPISLINFPSQKQY